MKIYLLRHATLIVTLGQSKLLIDPMFGPAGASEPIANTPNPQRNPLVDLPVDEAALLALIKAVDGVIVTHLHNDHWDAAARELLPKSLPIFCQPEDVVRIKEAGFEDVTPVEDTFVWRGIELNRTGGQHGRGEIARRMAPVSGFVLNTAGEPVLYIAGDTIWCAEVAQALRDHQPEVIVVNAGAAQFTSGDPITMTADDVVQVAHASPEAAVIAVHLEAINHCLLSRGALTQAVQNAGVSARVYIPQDGDTLSF